MFSIGFTGGKVLKDKSNAMDETENATNDVLNQTVKPHTEWWIKNDRIKIDWNWLISIFYICFYVLISLCLYIIDLLHFINFNQIVRIRVCNDVKYLLYFFTYYKTHYLFLI